MIAEMFIVYVKKWKNKNARITVKTEYVYKTDTTATDVKNNGNTKPWPLGGLPE